MIKTISNQDRVYKYSEDRSCVLGKGAFAEVYKGIYEQTQREVAIKVINKSNLRRFGDDIIVAIGREVNILQQLSSCSQKLNCPFIVQIFDCFETTNNIYIILEFCNGGTLQKIIDNKKCIKEEESIFIIYQVLMGIDYLAKENIAHRDLKPENIFIHNGVFKIGDFGFATQKNIMQTTLGTYPYMAPEFFNSNDYGIQVDMWALGVMLHYMLFNKLYFIGSSQYEVTQNILKKKYVITDNSVSQQMKDFLYKCIEPDKAKRIKASDALKHPLFDNVKKDPKMLQLMSPEQVHQPQTQQGCDVLQRIVNLRNGLFLFIYLAEELEANYLEDSKFDIFFLIKHCYVELIYLFNELRNLRIPYKYVPSIDMQAWQVYIKENNETILQQLNEDIKIISQKFQSYNDYLQNFISQNLTESKMCLQIMINTDLNQPISPDYLKKQFKQNTDFFFNKYQLNKQSPDQAQVIAYIRYSYMFLLADNFEKVIQYMLVDFEQLQVKRTQYSVQDYLQQMEQLKKNV